jgi:hypothetical protein
MRLAELWPCLWWGHIMDQEVHRGTALGHLLAVPLGNGSLRVWISMTSWDWQASSHRRQWRFYDWSFPCGGIITLGHHYSLTYLLTYVRS